MTTATKQTYTHAIIYVGAPYGENEDGHIVSRHKIWENAAKAFEQKFSGRTGALNHEIREIK